MRSNLLISMAALLSLTTVAACSQTTKQVPILADAKPTVVSKERVRGDQTVPGSYIVKASGDSEAVIRRVFAQYGVVLVNSIGNEQFEIRLERDPGLEVLNSLVVGSNGAVTAIQPNFVYRAY
jgi:hypothetical protein